VTDLWGPRSDTKSYTIGPTRVVLGHGKTTTLGHFRKGDEPKDLMAALIRWLTEASTEWIAKRLQMGHPGSVSRQVGIVKRDDKLLKKPNDPEEMCHCGD